MHSLKVHLPRSAHEYPIVITRDVVQQKALLKQHLHAKQLLWVSQENIWQHYGQALWEALPEREHHLCLLGAGEAHKNWASLQQICDAFLSAGLGRDAQIIALGGGIVGDVAGFAASIVQRGVSFIQMPTTLLAQVDSSVGGKTGINHARGKNLIGSFHQADAVLMDTAYLKTLPPREWAAGWAEIIKYALICDEALFDDLEAQRLPLETVIARCCQHKAEIVMADEREQGQRALLNLGHTFAHAIEALGHYQRFNHGEAVAIGLMAALHLSRILGYPIDNTHLSRTEALLQSHDLPTRLPPEWSPEALLAAMQSDKKKQNGKLRFIILERFCAARLQENVPEEALHQVLRVLQEKT